MATWYSDGMTEEDVRGLSRERVKILGVPEEEKGKLLMTLGGPSISCVNYDLNEKDYQGLLESTGSSEREDLDGKGINILFDESELPNIVCLSD